MTYTGATLLRRSTALPRCSIAAKSHGTAVALKNSKGHIIEKRYNFLLRTSFSVILDFPESLFRGLSNPAKNKPQDQKVQVL